MEESHQEATEKEVERILGYLKSYYQDDRKLEIIFTHMSYENVQILGYRDEETLCRRIANSQLQVFFFFLWRNIFFGGEGGVISCQTNIFQSISFPFLFLTQFKTKFKEQNIEQGISMTISKLRLLSSNMSYSWA